ncbi:MAG: ATP-binding protein [Clostridia bacterium]|nr:ATP-binding protein [Clostridia bacterium]
MMKRMTLDWNDIPVSLASVVVFRNVVKQKPLQALRHFLTLKTDDAVLCADAYSEFVNALYAHSFDLGVYLRDALFEDENEYVLARAHGDKIPAVLQYCVDQELMLFSALSRLDPQKLAEKAGNGGYVAPFENTCFEYGALYEERMANVQKYGYGIFVANRMFTLQEGNIVPVRSADPITLDQLIGYEDERGQVIKNTRALLDGKPAANILLCGDAGTGKSSTVKAVTNLLACEGLRLIELRKEQILQLPIVMEELSRNPLKFIIFIDDLSFNKNDDYFGTLKAILEGSVSARNKNTVIYATSNRRHLIKESFSDRMGDEIHQNDTMQELISLSERFGLTVLFSKPNKDLYLRIVHQLAEAKQIKKDASELDLLAEAFALRKGGRSARAADQFTDFLLTQE